jgi:uncharacterized beta-barrel protein YwiB (DUF1934 family)
MNIITGHINLGSIEREHWPEFSKNYVDIWAPHNDLPSAPPSTPVLSTARFSDKESSLLALPLEIFDQIIAELVKFDRPIKKTWYPTHYYRLLPPRIRRLMMVSRWFGATVRQQYHAINTFEVTEHNMEKGIPMEITDELENQSIKRIQMQLNIMIFEKLEEGEDEEMEDTEGSDEEEENKEDWTTEGEFYEPGIQELIWVFEKFRNLQEIVVLKWVDEEEYIAAAEGKAKMEKTFPMKIMERLFYVEMPMRFGDCKRGTKLRRIHLEVFHEMQGEQRKILGPPLSMGPDAKNVRIGTMEVAKYYSNS